MTTNKTKAYGWGYAGIFITLLAGALSYYDQSMLGFPDGHLTEFDFFYKQTLFPIFIGLNIFFLLVFILQLWVKKRLRVAFFIYFITLIVFFAIQYYFSVTLENGQGG